MLTIPKPQGCGEIVQRLGGASRSRSWIIYCPLSHQDSLSFHRTLGTGGPNPVPVPGRPANQAPLLGMGKQETQLCPDLLTCVFPGK